jgi:Neuraminidase (sialidase)
MNRLLTSLLLLVLSLPTTAQHADHSPHKQDKTSPGVASLDVYASPDNTLHLLLARRSAPSAPATLEYLRSTDSGQTWSPPTPVGLNQPAPSPIHRGQDAQVAASGNNLVAAWTTAGPQDRFGRGPIATATSNDSGKTWHPGPNPADDNTSSAHAFLDLAADATGAFHLVWLDARNDREGAPASLPSTPHPLTPSSNSPPKALRYARSTDHGKSWSPNQTLDPATCECCWNTIACTADDRLAVLFRDRDPRDMALVTSPDLGRNWSTPTRVGAFDWNITACPHVGGALAFAPDAPVAHAIVWNARDTATRGAYVLTSRDNGHTWSTPTQLGNDPKSWHTDLATAKSGHVAAVYDAYTEDGGAIFAVTSTDAGRTWSAPKRLTPETVSATHPRVVRTGDTFRVFWTQSPTEGGPATWETTSLK